MFEKLKELLKKDETPKEGWTERYIKKLHPKKLATIIDTAPAVDLFPDQVEEL